MSNCHIGAYTTTGSISTYQFAAYRFHNGYKVVEDAIGYNLVENALVPITLKVKFQ
jgi:hypothetical protein